MQVHTFIGKLSHESLRQMDEQINEWLEKNGVEPKHITQAFCQERHQEVNSVEPVLVTSIWY